MTSFQDKLDSKYKSVCIVLKRPLLGRYWVLLGRGHGDSLLFNEKGLYRIKFCIPCELTEEGIIAAIELCSEEFVILCSNIESISYPNNEMLNLVDKLKKAIRAAKKIT